MRWLSAIRGVSSRARGSPARSGSVHADAIGSSSDSRPSAASRSTSSANTGLVSEATLYSVRSVAGTPGACSPYTRVHATAPSRTYATARLGTLCWASHCGTLASSTAASESATRSGARSVVRAAACWAAAPAGIVPDAIAQAARASAAAGTRRVRSMGMVWMTRERWEAGERSRGRLTRPGYGTPLRQVSAAISQRREDRVERRMGDRSSIRLPCLRRRPGHVSAVTFPAVRYRRRGPLGG